MRAKLARAIVTLVVASQPAQTQAVEKFSPDLFGLPHSFTGD